MSAATGSPQLILPSLVKRSRPLLDSMLKVVVPTTVEELQQVRRELHTVRPRRSTPY